MHSCSTGTKSFRVLHGRRAILHAESCAVHVATAAQGNVGHDIVHSAHGCAANGHFPLVVFVGTLQLAQLPSLVLSHSGLRSLANFLRAFLGVSLHPSQAELHSIREAAGHGLSTTMRVPWLELGSLTSSQRSCTMKLYLLLQ